MNCLIFKNSESGTKDQKSEKTLHKTDIRKRKKISSLAVIRPLSHLVREKMSPQLPAPLIQSGAHPWEWLKGVYLPAHSPDCESSSNEHCWNFLLAAHSSFIQNSRSHLPFNWELFYPTHVPSMPLSVKKQINTFEPFRVWEKNGIASEKVNCP